MTTQEAHAYLRRYQLWRTGKDERNMEDAGLEPHRITEAIDIVLAAVPVLLSSLKSTRALLAKCQVQRERFHAQLRAKQSTPPT
jgi:hypothetical protein